MLLKIKNLFLQTIYYKEASNLLSLKRKYRNKPYLYPFPLLRNKMFYHAIINLKIL